MDWLNQLSNSLQGLLSSEVSILAYVISIGLGLVAGITECCVLPIIPIIVGYIGGQKYHKRYLVPLSFFLGSATVLVALGMIFSFTGEMVSQISRGWWNYIVAGVVIPIGLVMVGVINIHIPLFLTHPNPLKYHGVLGGLVFGVLLGSSTTVCSAGCGGCGTPVLPLVLTYVTIKGQVFHGLTILATFAIGKSLPIFFVGTISEVVRERLLRWSLYVRKFSGVLLISVGLYFLWIA